MHTYVSSSLQELNAIIHVMTSQCLQYGGGNKFFLHPIVIVNITC